MSRKSERLVNLTIALLHTPRFMTKSEIFSKVAGYEGTLDAKERMFERDKDELRKIGIEIAVQNIDPLFHDEAGYRINPSSYSIQIADLAPTDVTLMALGVQMLKTDNRDLLLRLRALGVESGSETPIAHLDLPDLTHLISAINDRNAISFTYISADGVHEKRTLEPYAIYSRSNRWFFVGRDSEKAALRTFRTDRVVDEIKISKSASFERDPNFSLETFLHSQPQEKAVIRVRKDTALDLRLLASDVVEGEEWDELRVSYFSLDWISEKVLWHCENALVVSPDELRSLVIQSLQKVADFHE